MPGFGNPGVDLKGRQLSAFTGFGTLSHFDLQVGGAGQIGAGNTEAAGSHLFDGAVAPVAVFIGVVPIRIFTALTAVAFSADAVHGDGQVFMGFLTDDAFKMIHANPALPGIGGQEDQTAGILIVSGQTDGGVSTGLAQKPVGHLHQNACAVAGGFITTAGPTMGKVDQDFQTVGDDPVRFLPFEVTHHADPAGIMFKAGIV